MGLVSYCWVLSYMGRAAFVAIDPLCKPEDTAALLAAFERDVPGMKHYVAVSDRVSVLVGGCMVRGANDGGLMMLWVV